MWGNGLAAGAWGRGQFTWHTFITGNPNRSWECLSPKDWYNCFMPFPRHRPLTTSYRLINYEMPQFSVNHTACIKITSPSWQLQFVMVKLQSNASCNFPQAFLDTLWGLFSILPDSNLLFWVFVLNKLCFELICVASIKDSDWINPEINLVFWKCLWYTQSEYHNWITNQNVPI